jgi:hypothetical protein
VLEKSTAPIQQKEIIPSASDTQLHIKQRTLDIDPEINFIPWELNIQDFAAATARTLHTRGLLSLVLNQI